MVGTDDTYWTVGNHRVKRTMNMWKYETIKIQIKHSLNTPNANMADHSVVARDES